MPNSQCVFNPATALRRVFMPSNVGSAHSLHLTRIFVPALLALRPQARAYWAGRDHGTTPNPSRHSSIFDRDSYAPRQPPTSAQSLMERRVARQKQKKAEDEPAARVKVKLGRMPRDEEITWPFVHVKMPQANGHFSISNPQRVKDVLAQMDRKTTYLEVVVLPKSEDEKKDEKKDEDEDEDEDGDKDEYEESLRWPLCRIVNKLEELARQKNLKKQRRKTTVKEKEVELNWTLAPHDLDHKLKTLQKFLGKGYRVQVLLQKKTRGKATAKKDDAKGILERVSKAVGEVKGAKEWKGREGEILGEYKIFLQGKIQEEAAAKVADVGKDTSTANSVVAEEGEGAKDTSTANSVVAEEGEGAKDTSTANSVVAEEGEGASTMGQSQA
ncbi:hypothetical protein DHEL01_v201101 [Diaporthe helianthi]|uniref:Translation initiation factor 3 C-terminal domain-containing protein n=1 Tax=Diaporthe helianthi TaxID=158607 RepID=A0A2P5IDC1_DIAHE|nr:hypothetical protein DHEL01_v201101 [Diaporthe helianthi]